MVTYAVIVVDDPSALAWLGDRPVAAWLSRRLMDVRGVSGTFCVASPNLCNAASLAVGREGVVVTPRPAEVKCRRDFDKWVAGESGPCHGADAVVVVSARNPLQKAGRIESCIERVRHGACVSQLVVTTRPDLGTPVAPASVVRVPVGETRAFKTSAAGTPAKSVDSEADDIDAIDVATPEGFEIAQSVVSAGVA